MKYRKEKTAAISFPLGGIGSGSIGYYLREGEHDFMPENWDALLEFIERHL